MAKHKVYKGSFFCQYCSDHKDFANYITRCKSRCASYCGETIWDLADEYEKCKELVDNRLIGTYELKAFVDYILPPDKITENYAENFYVLSNKIEGTEHSVADYLKNPDEFVATFNTDLCLKFGEGWIKDLSDKKISVDKISLLFGVSNAFITVFLKDLFDELFVMSDDNSLPYDIEEQRKANFWRKSNGGI